MLYQIPTQTITSSNTCVHILPKLFKYVDFKPNTVNIDFGGGKYDTATNYLINKKVRNLVFDPYNRSVEENENTLIELQLIGGADTGTMSNVLNVINTSSGLDTALLDFYNLIKPEGYAYFTVYEGDKSGNGCKTSRGYQNNLKLESYLPDIHNYFTIQKIDRTHGIIICQKTSTKANYINTVKVLMSLQNKLNLKMPYSLLEGNIKVF